MCTVKTTTFTFELVFMPRTKKIKECNVIFQHPGLENVAICVLSKLGQHETQIKSLQKYKVLAKESVQTI